MDLFFHAVGFGIASAAIIAISAVSFSLQYGVTDVPNFAHGELLTVAAYAAYLVQTNGGDIWEAVVAAAAAGAVAAYLMYILVLRSFIRRSARLIYTVAVTAGVSLILQNLLGLGFGNGNVTLPLTVGKSNSIGPFLWTNVDLVVIIGGLAVMVGVHVVLQHTPFGRAQRAVAGDKELARASGIRVGRVITFTWLMAGAVAGLGGVALATSATTFGPTMGNEFLLVTLAAAVVGGVGKIYGAMVGALVIGLVTELSGAYLSAGYKQVAALAMLAVILLVRPNGLMNVSRVGAEA